MNSISSLVNNAMNMTPQFLKDGAQQVSRWASHSVRFIEFIPQQMQQNSHVAIAVVATVNSVFFFSIRFIVNLLDNRLENRSKPLNSEQRTIKQIFLNGVLLGGSVFSVNLLLSKATQYPLNNSMIAVITTAAVVGRILLNQVGKYLARSEKPVAQNKMDDEAPLISLSHNVVHSTEKVHSPKKTRTFTMDLMPPQEQERGITNTSDATSDATKMLGEETIITPEPVIEVERPLRVRDCNVNSPPEVNSPMVVGVTDNIVAFSFKSGSANYLVFQQIVSPIPRGVSMCTPISRQWESKGGSKGGWEEYMINANRFQIISSYINPNFSERTINQYFGRSLLGDSNKNPFGPLGTFRSIFPALSNSNSKKAVGWGVLQTYDSRSNLQRKGASKQRRTESPQKKSPKTSQASQAAVAPDAFF